MPARKKTVRRISTASPRNKALESAAMTPVQLATMVEAPSELVRRAVVSGTGDLVTLPFEIDELPARKGGGKVGPTADELRILERRAWVVRLRRQRYTMEEISSIMNISHGTVKKDIDWMISQWAEANEEELESYLEEETARLDEVEREAWRAYHHSRRDQLEVTEKISEIKIKGKQDKDTSLGTEVETTMKRKPSPTGDPRHLALVLKTIELRSRLRGLLEKDEAAVPLGPDGRPLPTQVTVTYVQDAEMKRKVSLPPED